MDWVTRREGGCQRFVPRMHCACLDEYASLGVTTFVAVHYQGLTGRGILASCCSMVICLSGFEIRPFRSRCFWQSLCTELRSGNAWLLFVMLTIVLSTRAHCFVLWCGEYGLASWQDGLATVVSVCGAVLLLVNSDSLLCLSFRNCFGLLKEPFCVRLHFLCIEKNNVVCICLY